MLDFLDETGNSNLVKTDPDFPIFGIGSLLISKEEYRKLEIGINTIKARYFTNPETFILHSAELTRPNNFKSDPRNSVLNDPGIRWNFYSNIDKLLSRIDFKIVAYFILIKSSTTITKHFVDPYFFAFENVLNRIIKYGDSKNTIVAKSRDSHLNNKLMAGYERICKVGTHKYSPKQIKNSTIFGIKDKRENVIGLQIIDLILATLGRKCLGKKEKPPGNGLSLKLLEDKIAEINIFPQKAKDPPASQEGLSAVI